MVIKMKKTIILGLLLCTLFVTGCGCGKKEKNEMHKCTHSAVNDNYDYDVEYNFESNSDDKLLKYTRKEIYSHADKTFLENMQKYKQEFFTELNKLDGFKYSDSISDDELTTEITIDFAKIDKSKLLEIDSFYLNFYDSDDEFNVNYAVDYYIGEEMTCS